MRRTNHHRPVTRVEVSLKSMISKRDSNCCWMLHVQTASVTVPLKMVVIIKRERGSYHHENCLLLPRSSSLDDTSSSFRSGGEARESTIAIEILFIFCRQSWRRWTRSRVQSAFSCLAMPPLNKKLEQQQQTNITTVFTENVGSGSLSTVSSVRSAFALYWMQRVLPAIPRLCTIIRSNALSLFEFFLFLYDVSTCASNINFICNSWLFLVVRRAETTQGHFNRGVVRNAVDPLDTR